ncbi:hypothetical protein KKA09_04220 [Patescibacteria group bacterium]|nr:hypothetical protein [Patescibacteria group bacterium]
MNTITIPKELAGTGDLIIVPQKEYEELLKLRTKKVSEVELTVSQKRILKKAKEEFEKGECLNWEKVRYTIFFGEKNCISGAIR